MRFARSTLSKLIRDERGAATSEYVVVIGLIIIAVIAILMQVGPKLIARWALVDQKLDPSRKSTAIVTENNHAH